MDVDGNSNEMDSRKDAGQCDKSKDNLGKNNYGDHAGQRTLGKHTLNTDIDTGYNDNDDTNTENVTVGNWKT